MLDKLRENIAIIILLGGILLLVGTAIGLEIYDSYKESHSIEAMSRKLVIEYLEENVDCGPGLSAEKVYTCGYETEDGEIEWVTWWSVVDEYKGNLYIVVTKYVEGGEIETYMWDRLFQ